MIFNDTPVFLTGINAAGRCPLFRVTPELRLTMIIGRGPCEQGRKELVTIKQLLFHRGTIEPTTFSCWKKFMNGLILLVRGTFLN